MELDTEVHQGLGRSQARLPGIDRQTETLEQTQKVGSVLQEPPTGGVQEKKVVQVGMEEQTLAMTETLDRADHASESPRSHRKTERKVSEYVHHPVHHKGQVALKRLRHGDAVIGILQVDSAAPKIREDARSNIPDRLHPEVRNNKELVETGEVYDEAKGATFLRDQEEPGEEKGLTGQDSPNLAPRKETGNENPNVRELGRTATYPVRRV